MPRSTAKFLKLPLLPMKIAVYVPSSFKNQSLNFIVETFFPLFEQLRDHRFTLITDANTEFSQFTRFETIRIKTRPQNPLLKAIWAERTLAGILKKLKPDIFISANNFCLSNTSLPQLILMPVQRIKLLHAKKARLLIVTSESAKKELLNSLNIGEDKIAVVYPSPGKKFTPLDIEKKEFMKTKYSEGKEYFLCNSNGQKEENFVGLLKSFSYFKKRQQSAFKLLVTAKRSPLLEKTVGNYKYRKDVVFVYPDNPGEKAAITGAAYAIIFPFSTQEDIAGALGAMQAGVPVITTRDSSINEIALDAVLNSEKEIIDIGEKMMLIYKDEMLRSQLVEKGKELVTNFTAENSANQLWQSIMKALN